MSGVMQKRKRNPFRVRSTSNKKWKQNEELALIDFFKQNPDIEKPCARVYYTKFLFESGIDVDWKLVRCKARNMRTVYLKAKEYEFRVETNDCNIDDVKNQILRICWYVDEFDILFPNLMNNYINKCPDPILDDEFSKDESNCSVDNSSKSLKINILPEEESTTSSLCKSLDGGLTKMQNNLAGIKMEKQDEDENIKRKAREMAGLNNGKKIKLKEREFVVEPTPFRNRSNPIRKWQRNEEIALLLFLKQNRDFEKPNSRIYYSKFLHESEIDTEWKLVRNKVRNMRMTYRKAKEHEIKQADSSNCKSRDLKIQVLKICWFVDDFDNLFPNEMDNSACLQAYKNPDSIFDDELFNNVDNLNNLDNTVLSEDDLSSLSNSIDGDLLSVQENFVHLKNEKRDEVSFLKQQELELAKEKLNFEKEKFRQEIRLKEKEIESEEKLKVMEFQMKERIAMKKLEIDEMLALRSIEKPESSYNSIYHNLT